METQILRPLIPPVPRMVCRCLVPTRVLRRVLSSIGASLFDDHCSDSFGRLGVRDTGGRRRRQTRRK